MEKQKISKGGKYSTSKKNRSGVIKEAPLAAYSAGRSRKMSGVLPGHTEVTAESHLQQLTSKYRLRQETVSRLTGFSPRAVAEWARGKEPSAPAKKAFAEMDRLLDALSALMSVKDVGRWLKEPNPALDGSTPVQVIERGHVDRIWRMLYHVESGQPG